MRGKRAKRERRMRGPKPAPQPNYSRRRRALIQEAQRTEDRKVDAVPAVRELPRLIVHGVEFKDVYSGELLEFVPTRARPRERSRYTPHQGSQECARRRQRLKEVWHAT